MNKAKNEKRKAINWDVMGRLQTPLLERIESFCDRVVRVGTALESAAVSRRIVDQMVGSGTSVGANIFEADEAMSRPDFVKCLSIAAKELSETRFWLRLCARHGWVAEAKLDPLLVELAELRKIVGTMISRSRKKPSTKA